MNLPWHHTFLSLHLSAAFTIRLPSDSPHVNHSNSMNRTPLVLAISFPLLGWIRDFHPLETCAARRTIIMTTSSAGGFLCGYKPVVLAGSKEPLKIRHAHSYHRQALKGFSLCLVYWLTRKRVYVLFQ